MTTPNDPGFGELNRGLGRVEKTLDRIVEKLDGHGVELAEHRVRLDNHDNELKGLHETNQRIKQEREEERQRVEQAQVDERRHRAVIRWTTLGSVMVGILGFAGGLIALLH